MIRMAKNDGCCRIGLGASPVEDQCKIWMAKNDGCCTTGPQTVLRKYAIKMDTGGASSFS
jgi:hypothetical protein